MLPRPSAYLNLLTVASVSGSTRTELLVVSVRHSTRPSPSGSTALLGLSVSAAPLRIPTALLTRSSMFPGLGHCENSSRTGPPLSTADTYASDSICRCAPVARPCRKETRTSVA